ncbi:hypothetical protein DLJ49_17385 [Rhodovulum sp. 12E13]|nr:hypothetical protein DLJ49_17385 [Rhodovulum sp. 12E13]
MRPDRLLGAVGRHDEIDPRLILDRVAGERAATLPPIDVRAWFASLTPPRLWRLAVPWRAQPPAPGTSDGDAGFPP